MDNRDIFDFDFVDRTDVYYKFQNFLAGPGGYLWIDGESGVGKSFVIKKKLLNTNSSFSYLYMELKAETEKNNCISELLMELQEISGISFAAFIAENYSTMFDIGKRTVFELAKSKSPDLEWFFDILFNSNFVFLRKDKEKTTALKVIETYIDQIIGQKKLCIIIDNFTYCDKKSLVLLAQLFHHYIGKSGLYSIFVTTSSVLKTREDIQALLTEQLPVPITRIYSLKDAQYFYTILENIFDINSVSSIVPTVFNICEGNPERLKELIRKLYLNDGIYIPSEKYRKAKIDLKKLKKILFDGFYDLSDTDFTENERFIIMIMLGFGVSVPLEILVDCVLYIHRQLFGATLWSSITVYNLIRDLIEKNILEKEGTIKPDIKFIHDRTFFQIQLLFEDDISRPLYSHYFYNYILENRDKMSECMADIDYLRIYHAFLAEEEHWQAENYQYAYNKYLQKNYLDAEPIFKRAIAGRLELTAQRRLVIAETFYETGDYQNAKNVLINPTFSSDDSEELYKYYFILGKTENVLLNEEKAIDYFDKALKYAPDREHEILILHLKQQALIENYDGKKEARKIFDSIALHLSKEEKNMRSVCYLLRDCNPFYTGDKAKEFFKLALEIAQKYGTSLDEAYVKNNYGLELFRTGSRTEAYNNFKSAYNTLSDIKFHESSYPLNNLAVAEIFKGNYLQAVEHLTEARYVNQSKYAELAIKTHLMVCYRNLKEDKQCFELIHQLEHYIMQKKITDFTIIRKISLNLCISYLHYGEQIHARENLSRCLPYAKGTMSEYRACKLNNQLHMPLLDASSSQQSNAYYTGLDLEPWIITLSHD